MERPADGSRLFANFVSPTVGFPVLWLVAIAVAQIHVLSFQRSWSATVWIVILVVPVAFVAGGVVARAVVNHRVAPAIVVRGVASRRRLLGCLLLIGFAELAREYVSAGAVPLLTPHIDATRVSIHPGAFGVLVDTLTVVAIVAIASPPRLLARSALPELAIATLALLGFALSGGRQAAAVAVVSGIIARALYVRPPRLWPAIGAALFGVTIFSLLFYIRTSQEIAQPWAQELYGEVLPRLPPPLVLLIPVHLALAVNLDVLARVVGYFPHSMPYGHGAYDAWALHSIVHARWLQDVTAKITPPWVVSTVAGPLWADGGIAVVATGCVLAGAITTAPYALYRRTRRFSHAVLASYFIAVALYCVYDNLLTEFKDWVFIALGLLLVGMRAEATASGEPVADARISDREVVGGGGHGEHNGGGHGQPGWRHPRVVVPAAVTALAALIAIVVVVANQGVTSARRADLLLPHAFGNGWTAISPTVSSRRLILGRRAAELLSGPLATDSGAGASQVIWAFSSRSGALSATPLSIVDRRVTAGRAVALPPPPTGSNVVYAAARWGLKKRPAAFELAKRGTSIAIRVSSLTGPGRVLLDAQTPSIPIPVGSHRDLAIASADGTSTDLVVVDRGLSKHAMQVRIESGASGFTQEQTNVETRAGAFPAASWKLAVGAVETSGADLALIGSGSKLPTAPLEVHVLLDTYLYRTFGDQTTLGMTIAAARPLRFLIGRVPIYQMLYAVDSARGTIVELVYT